MENKGDFQRVHDLLVKNDKLVDPNIYNYEIENYQSLVNGLLVILQYSEDKSQKISCYNLFNKLVSKKCKLWFIFYA